MTTIPAWDFQIYGKRIDILCKTNGFIVSPLIILSFLDWLSSHLDVPDVLRPQRRHSVRPLRLLIIAGC